MASTRGKRPGRRGIEDPTYPIDANQLAILLSGMPAASGKAVNPRNALGIATVWACVRIISSTIGRMPLMVFEKQANGRRRPATGHPLYKALKRRPHPWMTSFSCRAAIMANTLLWGNGYAEILRNMAGRAAGMFPIEAERVTPHRAGDQMIYRIGGTERGQIDEPAENIVHVPGMTMDGVRGMSVVRFARQTMGAQLAADEFAGRILANSLRPPGVITVKGKLGPQGVAQLRDAWAQAYSGPGNAGKPLILQDGYSWAPGTMPLEDAEFVHSTSFRVEDICRWFNVPPHLVQHLIRSTNNNIEQQSLDFLAYGLMPWITELEQEFEYKLLDEEEQDRLEISHMARVAVQIDAKGRSEYYAKLRECGAINPDMIAEREDLDPLPDGRGLVYLVPANMMPAPTQAQADELIEAFARKGGGQMKGYGKDKGDGQDKGADEQDPKDGEDAGRAEPRTAPRLEPLLNGSAH
jgi:HK97 family phage portal protein